MQDEKSARCNRNYLCGVWFFSCGLISHLIDHRTVKPQVSQHEPRKTGDPWLGLQVPKRHVTSPNQGLSSLAPGGGKSRDPVFEVESILHPSSLVG